MSGSGEVKAAGKVGMEYYAPVVAERSRVDLERIITFKMTPDEQKLMAESVSHVKDLVGTVRKLFPDLA